MFRSKQRKTIIKSIQIKLLQAEKRKLFMSLKRKRRTMMNNKYNYEVMFDDKEILKRISAYPMALWCIKETN